MIHVRLPYCVVWRLETAYSPVRGFIFQRRGRDVQPGWLTQHQFEVEFRRAKRGEREFAILLGGLEGWSEMRPA